MGYVKKCVGLSFIEAPIIKLCNNKQTLTTSSLVSSARNASE